MGRMMVLVISTVMNSKSPVGIGYYVYREVYVSGSNPEESKQHNIIYVQTGYNTLKQVRKYKFGSDEIGRAHV